jgi:hypothetical protein
MREVCGKFNARVFYRRGVVLRDHQERLGRVGPGQHNEARFSVAGDEAVRGGRVREVEEARGLGAGGGRRGGEGVRAERGAVAVDRGGRAVQKHRARGFQRALRGRGKAGPDFRAKRRGNQNAECKM